MDNWSKEETDALRKFWQGDIGKKYLKRIEDTKKQLLQAAMGSGSPDESFKFAMIANGFDSVLQDIKAAVDSEEKTKEDVAAKKK